jgi:hypothetical protein
MSQLNIGMVIIAIVAAAGIIIGTVGIFLTTAQSANAWHCCFESKKDCREFFIAGGNTT